MTSADEDAERSATDASHDGALTREGLVLGTPAYMAPEQALGDPLAIGAKSDVYGLGAILYELVGGRAPYVGRDPIEILRRAAAEPPTPLETLRPELPADLRALVERAMERDPARRLASARVFAEELEAFRRGLNLRVYEYSALEQLRRIVRRNRFASAALVAALLALVAGLVASLVLARRAGDARELAVAETERTRAALVRAEGQRLAAISSLHAERDPSLALLLGIESAQRAPGLESSSALHDALDRLLERRELRGHEGYVHDVAFSPDGAHVASAAEDGTVRVWDARHGKELVRIVARASSVVFAPDGSSLAIVDEHGGVTLWSATEGTRLARLVTPQDAAPSARAIGNPIPRSVPRVAFAPDGSRISAFSTSGLAALFSRSSADRSVWTSESGTSTSRTTTGPASRAFADDGSTVWAVPGAPPRVVPRDGKGERALSSTFALVQAVAFSADGTRLATAESERVRVWDASTFELVRELAGLELDPTEPSELVLSRHGDRLLQNRSTRAYVHGPWRAFDVETGAIVAEGTGGCRAALAPDGGVLAAIDSEEQDAILIDARTGERIATTRGHRYGVTRIAFAPDGRSIVTASRDRLARVFAIAPGWTKETWDGLVGTSIEAFDGSTSSAIVRTAPEVARWRDARDGRDLGPSFPMHGGARVRAFDAERGRVGFTGLFTASLADEVDTTSVVDARRGVVVYTLPVGVTSMVLTDPRRDVLSLGDRISERDPLDGTELASFPFDGRVLAASADGRELVGWRTHSPNVLEILERATGRTLAVLEGHRGLVISAAYSPDGTRLVTAAADASARVWDLASRAVLRTLRWPAIETLRASFDDDGGRVIVQSGREVRVYSVAEDRELVVLAFRRERATSGVGAPVVGRFAGFAPDHERLALCEPDGRVRLSPIDPLPLARACVPRELEPNELVRFQIGDEAERAAATDAYYERHRSANREAGLARTAQLAGDLDEAVRRASRAVEFLGNWPDHALLLARVHTQRASASHGAERDRDVDAAFTALARARDLGADAAVLAQDETFEPLRADPRWPALAGNR